MEIDVAAFAKRLALAGNKPTENLAHVIRELEEFPGQPAPWEAWTLICLWRYRQLQLWATEVITSGLMPSLPEFGQALENKRDLEGYVPMASEWSFALNGVEKTCNLANRVTGQEVTVIIRNTDTEPTIEAVDFVGSVYHLNPDDSLACERRLLELHPSPWSLELTYGQVRISGAMRSVGDEYLNRLADEILENGDSFSAFCTAWQDPDNRLWLSALIGDWEGVEQLASASDQAELARLASARAAVCRQRRIASLRKMFQCALNNQEYTVQMVLPAMSEVGDELLEDFIREAFSRNDQSSLAAAFYALETDDPSWCPEMFQCFEDRVRDAESLRPATYLGRFLVEHDYRADDVLAALAPIAPSEAAQSRG